MKTHEILLQGYEAECDEILVLGTEDSFGTERLHISQGEDWDGLTVTAVFTNGSSTEVIADAQGMIHVPAEAMAESTGESFGRIVFKGTADGVQRVSGDVLYIALPHGPMQGGNSFEPTPDQFNQFVGMVSDEADRAEAAAERAEAAGDVVDPALVKQFITEYLNENPVQPTPLDTTLSNQNEAAEAKAVGDALLLHEDAVQQQIAEIELSVAALDKAKQPAGDYLTAESDPTVPAWAKQEKKPSYTCSEIGAAPAVESSEYSGCYYRTVNGNIEWLNPPMELGVEYLTTQRHEGKEVYVKAVDLGTLPDTASKTVAYCSDGAACVKHEVFFKNTDGSITQTHPFITSAGVVATTVQVTKKSVIIKSHSDLSGYTGCAHVYYTRD